MDSQTREAAVKKVINGVTQIPLDEITPEKALVEDLRLDSLDQVEIIMGVEDEFGIEIADADAGPMRKVIDILQYLECLDLAKAAR